MDIAIVYESQHRAILSLEKGEAGEHAFDEAFAALGTVNFAALSLPGYLVSSTMVWLRSLDS